MPESVFARNVLDHGRVVGGSGEGTVFGSFAFRHGSHPVETSLQRDGPETLLGVDYVDIGQIVREKGGYRPCVAGGSHCEDQSRRRKTGRDGNREKGYREASWDVAGKLLHRIKAFRASDKNSDFDIRSGFLPGIVA
jgi:hypothetical protein